MAAMMLPSELPLLRLDFATARSRVRTVVLAAGYISVWLAVGAAAMRLPFTVPVVWVLVAAALYELTPLKRRCLTVCRSPLARVVHGWRDGLGGAFLMGIQNGIWCLGCCVGLTTLLIALDMTNVWWMLLIGTVILAEKTVRFA